MSSELAYDILVTAALSLLVLTTGGIAYLTILEWRDRRRREKERRGR